MLTPAPADPVTPPVLRRVALAGPGALWLSAMPGRQVPLEVWSATAAQAGIDALLCLCTFAEIVARAPDYAQALRGARFPIARIDHPVPDFGVPPDPAAFARTIAAARDELAAGRALAIHCNAGIGRTGVGAICLLASLGMPLAQAEALVRAAGAGPETEAQRCFVQAFAAKPPPQT